MAIVWIFVVVKLFNKNPKIKLKPDTVYRFVLKNFVLKFLD